MRRVLCLLAVLLATSASNAAPLTVVSTGLAAKMATEQFVVHSTALDRDMLIEVTRPFAPLSPNQTAPAVYLLDGGYEFAGLEGWMLGGSGGINPAYMVAVGYKPADYGKRDADLTSQPVSRGGHTEPGRALAYRTFLIEELRPFIEARYSVDPRQAVLVGHSLGGSFAAALLADRPAAFSGYVIGSPAIWNEPELVTRVAVAKGLGERIFVAVGANEEAPMVQGVGRIAAALEGNKTLSVHSQVFPGATHLSYYPELIAQGLAYVLPPKNP